MAGEIRQSKRKGSVYRYLKFDDMIRECVSGGELCLSKKSNSIKMENRKLLKVTTIINIIFRLII